MQYYDVIFDDARHTLTVARAVVHYGALIGTHLNVTGMVCDGSRVVGVQAGGKYTTYRVMAKDVMDTATAGYVISKGLKGTVGM